MNSSWKILVPREGSKDCVMPAKAGIHIENSLKVWISAFAGMTKYWLLNKC